MIYEFSLFPISDSIRRSMQREQAVTRSGGIDTRLLNGQKWGERKRTGAI